MQNFKISPLSGGGAGHILEPTEFFPVNATDSEVLLFIIASESSIRVAVFTLKIEARICCTQMLFPCQVRTGLRNMEAPVPEVSPEAPSGGGKGEYSTRPETEKNCSRKMVLFSRGE